MQYLKALEYIHNTLNTNKYVEIGVRHGYSLQLAPNEAIGIDPDMEIDYPLSKNIRLFELTSDDFFAKYDLNDLLEGSFDLAFIDGMHLAEFALRDFMNLEKYSGFDSIIVIDDVFPEQMEYASRIRKTLAWTGDVYKLIRILIQYRPELQITIFDIGIKGMAIISNLNNRSEILRSCYDQIIKEIDQGVYDVTNRDQLSVMLKPESPERLIEYIKDISKERSKRKYISLLKDILTNNIYADLQFREIYLRECLEGQRNYNHDEYLHLEKSLPNDFLELLNEKENGRFYKRSIKNAGFSHSMIGDKRMASMISTLDIIRKNNIPGDFFECGVWRGGASIMMKAYNDIYNLNRKIYLADSFDGLPKPSLKLDVNMDLSKINYPELAIDLETVKNNFIKYDILSKDVIFLKGWFRDTLPKYKNKIKIAILRLDGDLYESTYDALTNLYGNVQIGGVIYVDDWGLHNCRQAIVDFFQERNLGPLVPIQIDWTGVYWIKKSE